jgi:Tfp pilus assembly protein PilE
MYLDIASLVKRSRYTGEVQLGQGMEPKTKSVVFMSIFGLYTIQTLSLSTRIEDQAFRSALCLKFSGPRQGIFDIFGEPAAGGPEILNYLPEDAIFAGELRLKNGIEIWQKFLTAVQSSVTPERYMNFQKNVANVQAKLGANLQDDIFTPLDGRIGYAVWGAALPMTPTVAIFAGCRDQKRLIAAIGSMLVKTTPPSIGTEKYRDVSYSIYPLPGAMYQLSCAALGNFVVITNQAAALEKCIDIYKDKKGGLAASAKFQRHAAKLPGKAVIIGYNEVEKMISPMVGVMTRAPMPSESRPNLPDFSVLIKYFFGNSMAVVCGPDSLTVESFSSFSGGLPLILAVAVRSSVAGYSEANVRSRVSRARADQRSLATALEAYYVDNNGYVPWATGDQGVNNFLPAGSASRGRPTFRNPSAGGPRTLTTPLAYITQLQPDPFAPDKGAVYSYYRDGGGWILLSAGPDGDYDIDPQKLYNSSVTQPSTELLSKAYDPTNGTISDGDIFRVHM